MLKYDFHRGYLTSNGATANDVLLDLDIYFQGQKFSCYAFAINNSQAMDVPSRFVLTGFRRRVAFVSYPVVVSWFLMSSVNRNLGNIRIFLNIS